MLSRKSCRRRTLTAKVLDTQNETNNAVPLKKRKSSQDTLAPRHKRSRSQPDTTDVKRPAHLKTKSTPDLAKELKDDKLDPVEKLLSMTCSNGDILHMDDADSDASPLASSSSLASAYPSLTLNFTQAINDNLRSHYMRLCKLPMEIHNDHSSFSILNHKPKVEEQPQAAPSASQVPFFKNVNFSSTPSFHKIDDYISYEDDEPLSTDSEHEDMPAPTQALQLPFPPVSGKMSFHYRQNDNMNLSLSDVHKELEPQDIFKILNKRSVISGRASEMIGTSNLMIKDFFL